MRVAILTASRERTGYEYLIRTFQSVVDTAQMLNEYHVFVDAHHLDDETRIRLEFNGVRPTIHLQPPNVPLLFHDRPLHFWGTPNFVRALRFVSDGDSLQRYGCVFEDDVEHTRGWDVKALQLCELSSSIYNDRFIFSLHHFYDVQSDFYFGPTLQSYSGLDYQLIRFKDPDLFYGGQGLMFPLEFGRQMADAYEDKWDATEFATTWAMDLGVKNMAKQLDVHILSCHPCLIQHTGLVDSVLRAAVADKDNWYRPDLVNRYFNADKR